VDTIFFALARKTGIPGGVAEKTAGFYRTLHADVSIALSFATCVAYHARLRPRECKLFFMQQQAAAQGLFWICRSFAPARNRLPMSSTSSATVIFADLFAYSSLRLKLYRNTRQSRKRSLSKIKIFLEFGSLKISKFLLFCKQVTIVRILSE